MNTALTQLVSSLYEALLELEPIKSCTPREKASFIRYKQDSNFVMDCTVPLNLPAKRKSMEIEPITINSDVIPKRKSIKGIIQSISGSNLDTDIMKFAHLSSWILHRGIDKVQDLFLCGAHNQAPLVLTFRYVAR